MNQTVNSNQVKQAMPHMTLAEIKSAVGGVYRGDEALLSRSVTDVIIDSRLASFGCLFIPIVGERVDGHRFIPQVFDNGALCVLSEQEPADSAKPVIYVKSTVQALQDLAAWYRSQLTIPVIGISGSMGKTSAKEMVAAVLSARFNTLKTEGNFNNRIGLPLTIFKIRPEHEAAVLEMGISDFGEMTVLAKMARPDIAMITNIADCHLEFLGDRAGVYRAKSEMFDYMSHDDSPIILRADDPILGSVGSVGRHQLCFYGMNRNNPNADVKDGVSNDAFVSNVAYHGIDGTDCTLHLDSQSIAVHVPLPGTHTIYHMMAGALTGHLLGMELSEIAEGITSVKTIPGHGHIIHTDKYTVFDDCYNANPDSMIAGLSILKDTDRRRVAILGDMGELGDHEKELHRKVGVFAGDCDIDELICIGELSSSIMEGYADTPAGKKAVAEGRAVHYMSKEGFMPALDSLLKNGDAILVKASHFMGFSSIVDAIVSGE